MHLVVIEAALTGKKEHIHHAAMLEPHTFSELPIDQIVALCDDLIDAHGDWLPKFKYTELLVIVHAVGAGYWPAPSRPDKGDMIMSYPIFDRSRLQIKPLAERQHDMHLEDVWALDAPMPEFDSPELETVAQRIKDARSRDAAVVMMMGAHVIKQGMSRFIVEMLRQGYVTHFALNGAGAIHDFELALIGATTESVARYVSEGQFGLWQETGRLNDIAQRAQVAGLGFGEALGKTIVEEGFPHKDISLLAAGYTARVPITVHVALGQDIIHEHPNCDGAALGAASYRDFLIFTQSLTNLEGGVVLNLGTAVMGPEVYLKALAMVRNVAHQEGRQISKFTTAVFDLLPYSGEDYHTVPPKTDHRYYYRPWKTMLVRTVQDGGESFYIQGDHQETLPNLWRLLREG